MSEWIPVDQAFTEPRAIRYDDYRSLVRAARTKPQERRPEMPQPTILYILDCGHVMPGKAFAIATLACLECNEVKTITDVHVYEWRAYCKSRHCTFARWCGLSKRLAEFHANQHAHSRPSHLVKVGYSLNPLSQRRKEALIKNGVILCIDLSRALFAAYITANVGVQNQLPKSTTVRRPRMRMHHRSRIPNSSPGRLQGLPRMRGPSWRRIRTENST